MGFARHSLEFSCLKERLAIYLLQKKKKLKLLCFWFIYLFIFVIIFFFFFTVQPEIITHPKNVTVEEGLPMNLFCNATGNPPPTLSWTKDGSPLNNNQGILFSGDNETLSIASINRSKSGNYRCVARNSLGNDSSNPANVDVQCECSSNSFLFCLIWKVKFYSRSIGFERYLAQMKVMGEVAMGSEQLKAKTLGITIQILN